MSAADEFRWVDIYQRSGILHASPVHFTRPPYGLACGRTADDATTADHRARKQRRCAACCMKAGVPTGLGAPEPGAR